MKRMCQLSIAAVAICIGLTGNPSQAQEVLSDTAPVAQPAAPELPPLLQRQWVRLGQNGEVIGNISVLRPDASLEEASDMVISLVHNGEVVRQARANPAGEFVFDRIQPGVHTLVGEHEAALLIMSLVIGESDGTPAVPINAVAVSTPPGPQQQALLTFLAEASADTPLAAPHPVAGASRSVIGTHRVAFSDAGTLRGHLSAAGHSSDIVDMSGTTVQILRDLEPIADARVSRSGEYEIEGLAPGPYAVVAFGPQGVLAMGFELVDQQAAVAAGETGAVAAAPGGVADALNAELAPGMDVVALLGLDPALCNPPLEGLGFACGAPLGGCAPGGGGGGGGHGHLAGWLALGGAIAAIAIAADDDDDDDDDKPASPSRF